MSTEQQASPAPASQDEGAADQPAADAHGGAAHDHPSEWQYVKVALVLAVITGAEVGVYYVPALKSWLVPILLTFAILKFAMVAMWFMHLRFDNRLFRRLFVTGLILATGVYLVMLTTFHVWTRASH